MEAFDKIFDRSKSRLDFENFFEFLLGIEFFSESEFGFENEIQTKVLFKDLNPGIAMAIVRFKFSRKLYFCFESVIRQKFNFSAFSEMAQNF